MKEQSENRRVRMTKRLMKDALMDLLCAQMITGVEEADGFSARLMQLYIASGTVGMLLKWINAGFPVSSREIAKKMYYYSRKLTG